jgi:inositol-hexakisphosphate/diphosphoinositol-pentakisphosphate 1-kinase
MCRVIVPFEYGLTKEQKIDVGLKIVHPLLKKVHKDLLWWDPGQRPENEQNGISDREWDKTGLSAVKSADIVKSHWRHVRTHLYFTSASHMYTLLNTIKLGIGSILVDDTDKDVKDKLDQILRLDFMSHFVFRLYENFNVEEDPSRFRLEIMVNRGAITNNIKIRDVKDHTIPIRSEEYVNINKKLNLEKLDSFLKLLENLDVTKFEQGTTEKSKKKKQK